MPKLRAIGGGVYAQGLRPAPQSRPSEQPRSDVLESSHFGPPLPLPGVPQLKSCREGCKCFITFESFIRTVRPGGREERREEPPRGSVWPEDRAWKSQAWKAKEKCQRGERKAESERKRGRRGVGRGSPGRLAAADGRSEPARQTFPHLGFFSLFFPFSIRLLPRRVARRGSRLVGAPSPQPPERCHCPCWRSNAGPAAVAGAIPTRAVCAQSPGRAASATQPRGRRERGASERDQRRAPGGTRPALKLR